MASGILKYDPTVYTPQSAKRNLDLREARAEYSRLRSIALKRLKRFEGTEFEDTRIYGNNAQKFVSLKDITTERQFYYLLSDLAAFLQSPMSTVSGQRDYVNRSIETLHSHGYTFVNKQNFKEFGEYMEKARVQSTARFFDSLRAIESLEDALDEGEENAAERALKGFEDFERQQTIERALQRRKRNNN